MISQQTISLEHVFFKKRKKNTTRKIETTNDSQAERVGFESKNSDAMSFGRVMQASFKKMVGIGASK
jgi:hypothetical protein